MKKPREFSRGDNPDFSVTPNFSRQSVAPKGATGMAQDWCMHLNNFVCQVAATVVAAGILIAIAKLKELFMTIVAKLASTSVMLKPEDVIDILQISERKLDLMVRDHEIPPPVLVGKRSKRFRKADIDGWIAAGCPKQTPPTKKRGK